MSGWYIKRGEKIVGPVDLAKLKELVADGRLHPTDLLATDMAGPWNGAGRSTLFAVAVTVHKGVLGGHTLSYDCPHCSAALKSKLDDAGNHDTCPECGRQYVVPGAAERKRIHEAEQVVAEAKQKEKEFKDAQREQHHQVVALRSASANSTALTETNPIAEPQSTTRACPYCGEEILSVAKKCKHCGEFLDRSERSPEHDTQTVELTAKRWKTLQLLGVLGIVTGFACIFMGMGVGPLLTFFGVILYICGRVAAWWYHG